MKKVSLIFTAVALSAGLTTAIASNVSKHAKASGTIFRYTSAGQIFTGTRPAAQDFFACPAAAGNICANAYTNTPAHTQVPTSDIFFSE